MTLNFYKNNSAPKRVNKDLTATGTLENVKVLQSKSLLYPVFELQKNTIPEGNYIYCQEWNRYYFIENISYNTAGRVEITCSIDVLQTYSTAIRGLNCRVIRNEKIGVNYVPDNQLPLMPYKDNAVIEFAQSEFNLDIASDESYNFLLTVAGGGASE